MHRLGDGSIGTRAVQAQQSPDCLLEWLGPGPADAIGNEGHGISLIDPTPARVGSSLVLTYKTEYKAHGSKNWHTTTRLLAIDPAHPGRTAANPKHHGGGSVQISDSRSKYIEENPVLVRHGSSYTLFTSFDWFGTCNYTTRYRQNTNLWKGWLAKPHRALTFSKRPNTCGTGNGQVIAGATPGAWRFFFNGHLDDKSNPKARHTPRGPQGMYVGKVTWKSGRPTVSSLI